MPVGNQNDGIALLSGQVMASGSFIGQYIDWSHDPIAPELNWKHAGSFTSKIIEPSISIGITNNINLSLSQTIGLRSMIFSPEFIGDGDIPPFTSTHHRDEDSSTDFANAHGGILGDLTIIMKYVLNYATFGEGSRSFINAGIIIPSQNHLTSDPYFRQIIDTTYGNSDGIVDDDEKDEFLENTSPEQQSHKHFAMSEGLYRYIFLPSFYYKKKTNPVFFGITAGIKGPIHALTKDFGFKGGNIIEAHLTSLFVPTGKLKTIIPKRISLSLGVSLMHSAESGWDGYIAQNSELLITTPSIGLIYNTKKIGTFNISIRKPYYMIGFWGKADESTDESTDFKEDTDEIALSLNYRLPMKFYLW